MLSSSQTKKRLGELREEMAEEGVDAYLVPHGDEWGNEFLPECSRRLEWLTGFTGSAGFAIVLDDRAAIFIDGRYTEQVRGEVDGSYFEYRHIQNEPLTDWLAEHCAEGDLVGYDPTVHMTGEVRRLGVECSKRGICLVPIEKNLIDKVWLNRPNAPCAPTVAHPLEYAGIDSGTKRHRLADTLKAHNADATVLTNPPSVCWLLNIRGGDVPWTPLVLCRAVVNADESVCLFIDPQRVGQKLHRHLGPDVRIVDPSLFAQTLWRMGNVGMRVLTDPATTPSSIIDRLQSAGAIVVFGNDPCVLPKACKNGVEVEGARAAHRRDGVALVKFLATLDRLGQEGRAVTECSAAAMLADFRAQGNYFRGLSFPTISAVGAHGAIIHYSPTPETDAALEDGTLFLIDSGGQYLDGTTDVTRTIFIGAPARKPTREMRDIFTCVLAGHIRLAMTVFPKGTTGHQLDAIARQPLWEAGLNYDHGTGHGVGSYLNVHEGPQRITKIPTTESNTPLILPGMIVSNEPGYYKEGKYGIRIENLMVVVPVEPPEGGDGSREWLGFETLTLAPLDRSLINTSLLSIRERGWLNRYHCRICDTISDRLDRQAAEWLRIATAPLL